MSFEFYEDELQLLRCVGKVADDLSMDAYIVGGYVRDRLLNRPTKDLDFVCIGDGVKFAENVAISLGIDSQKVVVFKRFGTAMLRYQDSELEFVGARKESYSKDSRKPSVEPGSLEDDQNRRDFSINAMAIKINADGFGTLIDPFHGQADLQERVVRTPQDPDITFSDDPLRMVRAIRFATQLDFEIEGTTLDGISRNKQRLQIVSSERIMTELNKIILSPIPSKGFHYLSETGLLQIFFPEFEKLRGVEVRRGVSHKDNYHHTLEVLDNLSRNTEDLWLRWAAIMHDIAKPATKRFSDSSGWTFHGHEMLGAKMVPGIFKRLRLPLDDKMKYVQKLVRLHLRPISLTKEEVTDSAVRRLLFDAGDDIDDLMMLCNADITSKNEYKVKRIKENYELVKVKLKEVEEKDEIRNWQPPISGELIMETFDLKPCRMVGTIKEKIKEAILDGLISNEYEAAFSYMLSEGEKLGLSPKT